MNPTPADSPASSKADLFGERLTLDRIEAQGARNWLVTLVAKGGTQAIQFLTMLVLARLLAPADFGVLAMVMAVIGIAGIFRDLGLSAATIRQPEITDSQVNTLFWVNVAFGAITAVLAAASAPLVAHVYSDPRVAWVTVALAFNLLLGGLNTQHMALLQRSLRFGDLARIGIGSVVAGNALALAMAWAGAGYWALVASTLGSGVVNLWLSWRRCPWRPRAPAYDPSVRPMISFGGYLLAFNVLGFFGRNLHSLLIGVLWGATAVGFYNRAYLLFTLLLSYILAPLDLIAPATLSRLQDNLPKFNQYYLRRALLTTLATAPIGVVCALLADDIIGVLFGVQWAAAEDLLRLLGLAAVPQALCHSTGWLYLARGNSQTMMRWGFFGWTVLILSLFVGTPFGMHGIAAAYTASMFFLVWPCLVVALRGMSVTAGQVMGVCLRPVAAALLAALPLYFGMPALADWSAAARLAVCLGGYGLLYLALLVLVFGQRALIEEMIEELRRRRRGTEAAA